MSKFDNFVFMSICEVTLSIYSQTLYTSYSSYCKGILRSLRSGVLSNVEKRHIIAIYAELEIIYGFETAEANEYIIRYFESNRHEEFELVVRETKMLFPFTGN